jgi:hypothetical protein
MNINHGGVEYCPMFPKMPPPPLPLFLPLPPSPVLFVHVVQTKRRMHMRRIGNQEVFEKEYG